MLQAALPDLQYLSTVLHLRSKITMPGEQCLRCQLVHLVNSAQMPAQMQPAILSASLLCTFLRLDKTALWQCCRPASLTERPGTSRRLLQ